MLSPTPYSAVNPAPQAGKYTVLLGRLTPVVTDPQVAIPAIPEGWGFAILVITKNGWVRALGLLADGSTFSGNALLKADAHFAIYLQLPGKGLFAGDVAMREKVGESDGDGSLWWDKPAIQGGRFYPAGFRGTIPVQLSRFDALSFRQQIQGRSPTLIFKATLSGGDLEPAGDPIEKSLTFPTGNTAAILNPGNDRCHLRIHWNTGTIGGSFVHPSDRRIRPIGGVVFQKQGIGAGFFPGRQAIGQFELSGLPGEPTP